MKELYCSVMLLYMAVIVMKCMHTTIDGLGVRHGLQQCQFLISYVASLKKIATLLFRSPCCTETVSTTHKLSCSCSLWFENKCQVDSYTE